MTYCPPGCKLSHQGVLLDREYRDEVLDLDASRNTPAEVMNCFRFIRLCGILFEQISCDTIDATATFKAVS